MKVGIENTLETIQDLENVVVDGIRFAKASIGLGKITAAVKVVQDVTDLLAEAPLVLPELKDLDGEESGKIGAASYTLVKTVLAALVA